MNERIKKLAEQAGCYQETDYDGKLFWAMPEDSWEKFAELISTEEREACARTASEQATFGYDGHKIAKAIRARGEVK